MRAAHRHSRGENSTSLKRSTQATRAPGYFDGCPESAHEGRSNRERPCAVAKASGTSPAMFSSIYPSD